MRIDLLLVLLLETEDDLNRDMSFLSTFNLEAGADTDLCGVLVNVGRDWLIVNNVLKAS